MRIPALALAAACAALGAVAPAGAQLAPVAPASPPAQMPFDIPYGTPISLAAAKAAIAAAEAEARRNNWKMNIAVVDPNGELVAFERMDGAQIASVAISQHKARTAATYRRETMVFEQGVQTGNVYLLTLDGVIASRGGFPLVSGGKIIGAIGCSGGTGSQDAASCKAGADTVR